ncbi:hypothetical protein PU00_00825 [Hafnia alvei]|nr:hypothetical protein PU00_00825 [Hafnia alvei]
MRGASARPFNPRAFIRDAISASGRHAPSLAPPPLVETSCFYCSIYQNLNTKKTKAFVLVDFNLAVDLFRHVVLQPNRGMKARIRRQGCRRKNGGARMAIAVRSVKAGMTK